jgi:hypothetical protein
MPILYETYANPRRGRVQKRSIRPRRVRGLQEQEPDHYHVIEEYAVAGIYMTAEQLTNHVRDGLSSACEQKGEKLEYFKALSVWGVWKVVYTEYHIKYEAYIGGSPITPAVALAIIALCITILIVFAIWLVVRYVFEPIWGAIPPEAKPYVGTLLLVGAGLAAVGLGIYIIKSVIPKIKKKT